MKIEDINFPLEVKFKKNNIIYRITFVGRAFFARCCGSQCIRVGIESKVYPSLNKGFKEKMKIGFSDWGFSSFCDVCGYMKNEDYYTEERGYANKCHPDIVRKAWLKLADRKW